MHKLYSMFFLVLLVSFSSQGKTEQNKIARVLMLISSYGTEQAPDLSYDLEELAQSYLVMSDHDIELDIASPKGGAVMVKNNKDDLAYIQRFKALALTKLQNTIPSERIDVADYDAVFVVGGGGAMMDLPFHQETQRVLKEFVINEKVITAVCHGPAALVDIKMPSGEYFVKGRKVNSFTNVEERAFSKENADKFVFLIEDRLNQNGAVFMSNQPMLPFVAVDGNLITAQNPSSVAMAAEATLLKLGLKVKPRSMFKDEATLRLISQAKSNGTALIDIALATEPQMYDLNYLGVYGFYAYPLAEANFKAKEVEIMLTIARYFQHIEYDTALIQRLLEQNQNRAAQAHLTVFKARYPESDRIHKLQQLIKG